MMLVYLEAPGVAGKTLKLMDEAPTQEEQMEYARSLRMLKTGWTPEERKEYFSWFLKAASFKGGLYAWHRNGIGNRLREVSAPVLIATGIEDIVIPPSNALKLVNAISSAWLAQFPGGGHAFMAQYPRQLADLINGFLALG